MPFRLQIAVIFLLYVSFVFAVPEDVASWRHCIIRIGDYFAPTSPSDYGWGVNGCGYRLLRPVDVRKEILFVQKLSGGSSLRSKAVGFAGDSTGLRDFTQAVNMYAAPVEIKTIFKVASVPPRWPIVTYEPPYQADEVSDSGVVTAAGASALPLPSARARSNFTYYNMRYAYFAERVLREELQRVCNAPDNDGGFFFITLGNWDLNWKTHKKEPVPGLSRKFDYPSAIAYWTHYVGRMFTAIAEETHKCRGRGALPPIVIVREQFMPNCAAARFSASKHRKFKQCAPFLVPVVVPMYRRVLRGVGWAMNVPVVPTDHMFREDYKYCGISDGLHLDPPCMALEQQLLWNVAQLVEGRGVRQGWGEGYLNAGGSNVSGVVEALASSMVNATAYDEWMERLGLRGWYEGTSHATVETEEHALRQPLPEPDSHSTTLPSALRPQRSGDDADFIGLVVEKHVGRQRAAAPSSGGFVHRLVATLGWEGVVFFNIATLALVALVTREIRKS